MARSNHRRDEFSHLTPEGSERVHNELIQEGWDKAIAAAFGAQEKTRSSSLWDRALGRLPGQECR